MFPENSCMEIHTWRILTCGFTHKVLYTWTQVWRIHTCRPYLWTFIWGIIIRVHICGFILMKSSVNDSQCQTLVWRKVTVDSRCKKSPWRTPIWKIPASFGLRKINYTNSRCLNIRTIPYDLLLEIWSMLILVKDSLLELLKLEIWI